MNNCLVVFADDIDTKLLRADVTSITRVKSDWNYHYIITFQFVWLRFHRFNTETFAIYKCAIRTLNVFDVDLLKSER